MNKLLHSKPSAAALTVAGVWLLFHQSAVAQYSYAQRISPSWLAIDHFQWSGLLSNVDRGVTGSATVCRHAKIAVSAAHVTFDGSYPRSNNRFYRQYHSGSNPSLTGGVRLRGYWYWSSYRGIITNADFNRDFVVFYNYDLLTGGGHAGWWWSNSRTSHPLNRKLDKEIVGYPGVDAYYMNVTGPFSTRYRRQHGHYFFNTMATAGPGMSGGGVHVRNSGSWYQAGVHVSGNRGYTGAGVRALNRSAFRLMSTAIRSAEAGAPVYNSFSDFERMPIPDNRRRWTTKRIHVTGLPTRVRRLEVSVFVEHPYPRDLQVVVRAPNGRTRRVFNRGSLSPPDLVINAADFSSGFHGVRANGLWRVSARDRAPFDVGDFVSATLRIGATY